jgi:Flp pilus assembly protein TadD
MALAMTGWVEAILNEPAVALEHLHRAARLSPRDPRTWFIATGIGTAHSIAGDHHEAIIWLKRALSQNPRSTPARRILAASLASVGQIDQARETLQELLQGEPLLTISTLKARMRMLHENVWNKYAAALRLAGLPE